MLIRWALASLHLLALPLGLGAVWARRQALKRVSGPGDLAAVFVAEGLWAAAAVLWFATGAARLLGAFDKDTGYYFHDSAFLLKMALLFLVLLLEVWPMIVLVLWRIQSRRRVAMDLAAAPTLARVSEVQAACVVLMVLAATAAARGAFH